MYTCFVYQIRVTNKSNMVYCIKTLCKWMWSPGHYNKLFLSCSVKVQMQTWMWTGIVTVYITLLHFSSLSSSTCNYSISNHTYISNSNNIIASTAVAIPTIIFVVTQVILLSKSSSSGMRFGLARNDKLALQQNIPYISNVCCLYFLFIFYYLVVRRTN